MVFWNVWFVTHLVLWTVTTTRQQHDPPQKRQSRLENGCASFSIGGCSFANSRSSRRRTLDTIRTSTTSLRLSSSSSCTQQQQHEKQSDDDDDHHDVFRLLEQITAVRSNNNAADKTRNNIQIETLSEPNSFCNRILRVKTDIRLSESSSCSGSSDGQQQQQQQQTQQEYIAKIFSPLALERMLPAIIAANNNNSATEERKESNDHAPDISNIHRLVANHGLGPHIYASTENAILMEAFQGTLLTDDLLLIDDSSLLNNNNTTIAGHLGKALAKLHYSLLPSLTINKTTTTTTTAGNKIARDPDLVQQQQQQTNHDKNKNMLWHALHVMLSHCNKDIIKLETTTITNSTTTADINNERIWTLDTLQATVQEQYEYLESLNLPCVPLGHGDLKPSNVMLVPNNKNNNNNNNNNNKPIMKIQFIDLELAGYHYRGFDLAKLFRGKLFPPPIIIQASSLSPQDPWYMAQVAFFQSYQNELLLASSSVNNNSSIRSSIQELQREAYELEPMTFLEAAIFFLCMASLSTTNTTSSCETTTTPATTTQYWMSLAKERLEGYQECMEQRRRPLKSSRTN